MRKIVAAVTALGSVLAPLAVTSATAEAHAELESSTPGNGEMLSAPPDLVELVFTENVGEPAALEVLGPDGEAVPGGELDVVDDTMRRTYDPAVFPTGVYTVSYQVTSADGHPIAGNVTFMVHGEGESMPVDPGVVADDSDDTNTALVVVLVVTVIAALGGVLVATRRFVARPDGTTAP